MEISYYGDRKHIYSIDMMMAYVNIYKPKTVILSIADNIWQINQKSGDDNSYSLMDIITGPVKKSINMI